MGACRPGFAFVPVQFVPVASPTEGSRVRLAPSATAVDHSWLLVVAAANVLAPMQYSFAEAHHDGEDQVHPFLRASRVVTPAGVPMEPHADENPFEPNYGALGGVGILQDGASSGAEPGGVVVQPAFPSERLQALNAALMVGGPEAVAQVRAAVGGSAQAAGGWMPASTPDAALGFRPGSAKWKEAAKAVAHQAAALEAVTEERRRSERFFARADESRETEAAIEAAHLLDKGLQAAHAVEQRKARMASAAYYANGETSELGGGGGLATGVHRHAAASVGYRPGSAAARRASGGLYETPHADPMAPTGGHSHRLLDGEARRLEQQQTAAQRAIEAKAMKRSDEAVEEAAYVARREAQARVAMGSREDAGHGGPQGFGAHAERVAARKTLNIGLNAATAPPGRLHPRAHRGDTRVHNPYGAPYQRGGGFASGHVYAVP